jgi:glucose dehydrogenase
MPAALVSSCGIFLIVSALALIVSKSPGAVLVTYTYYAVLVGTVAFGFWVVPRDLPRWSLTAKVFLPVIR